MAYKCLSSFGITAILYTYRACKTLFGPIKPTNPSVEMAYKDQSSFGKPATIVREITFRTIEQTYTSLQFRSCHVSNTDLAIPNLSIIIIVEHT